MMSKGRPEKRARVEEEEGDGDGDGDGGGGGGSRTGVYRRKDKYVVEIRPPNVAAKRKLNLGTYESEHDAYVAADFCRFVIRSRSGKYGEYYFKESPVIFESSERAKSLCEDYKRLMDRSDGLKVSKKEKDGCDTGELEQEFMKDFNNFCDAARKFIKRGIKFEEFLTSDQLAVAETHGPDVEASPTPGGEAGSSMGGGGGTNCILSLEGSLTVDGTHILPLHAKVLSVLTAAEFSYLDKLDLSPISEGAVEWIGRKMREMVYKKFDDCLAKAKPCTVSPNEFPPIE